MATKKVVLDFFEQRYLRNGGFMKHIKELFQHGPGAERKINADDALPSRAVEGSVKLMGSNKIMAIFEFNWEKEEKDEE